MAQVSFENLRQPQQTTATQTNEFKLKDGQSAIVRILHDSTDTFDLVSTHLVAVPGSQYKRRVGCLRENDESPLHLCPLCERGEKIETRFFVHLLVYTQGADGKIVCTPMVWDRPFGMAFELRDKIAAYGPLSQHIFKISRTGSNFNDTKYHIDYALPTIYPPEQYPYDPNLFSNTIKYPHIYVMNKTFKEVDAYVKTGVFPSRETKQQQAAPAPTYTQPAAPAYTQPVAPQPIPQAPVPPVAPQPQWTVNTPTSAAQWTQTTSGNLTMNRAGEFNPVNDFQMPTQVATPQPAPWDPTPIKQY